ncbi:MAG: DUF5017 domain-containing protein [Bacteroidetes bacterium]|nr:DUF5017 domain-containing protein [Bacteroidota bacterium]
MKKIFYSLILGLAFAVLLGGCEKFNDQFEGLADMTKLTNVAAYTYTLTSADYTTISSAAKAATTDPAKIALATSIGTNKFFTNSAPASEYVPYLLKTKYPYGDLGSTAMITYTLGEDQPTYLNDLRTVNILNNADYQSAWGGGNYVSAFTPTFTPAAKIPAILAAKFPTAANGLYKFVEYNYSAIDAVTDITEVSYYAYDWSTHTVTSSPYTVVSEAGWMSKDVLGSLNWFCRTYSSNNYAQVSSYNSGAINQVYMISPEINLQTAVAPLFTFNIVAGYSNADCLTVWISENFDGTEAGIGTATWTDISSNFTLPQSPSGYSVSANAGVADLTAYAGKKVRIAFRYDGDGRSAANRGTDPAKTTTYQVDNVKVSEEKVALSVASSEKQYVTYKFNGSAWVPADNTFVALQPVDYTTIGFSYISSANVPLYIPNYLGQKFPYALEGNIKTVIYKSSSNPNYSGAAQFKLTNGTWVPNSFKITRTEQFVYSNAGWLFDPTVKMVMEQSDYQLMVDYVLATPAIAKFANPQYKNEEFYYGFGSRYSNVSFRLSYRNPYFSGQAYGFPASGDAELYAASTDAAKVALLWERLKKGMEKFAQLRYPNAVAKVSGVDVYYYLTTYLYYPTGVNAGNEYHEYVFKCTGSGNPPTFEYVSDRTVN